MARHTKNGPPLYLRGGPDAFARRWTGHMGRAASVGRTHNGDPPSALSRIPRTAEIAQVLEQRFTRRRQLGGSRGIGRARARITAAAHVT
jgi:hypothetical protein